MHEKIFEAKSLMRALGLNGALSVFEREMGLKPSPTRFGVFESKDASGNSSFAAQTTLGALSENPFNDRGREASAGGRSAQRENVFSEDDSNPFSGAVAPGRLPASRSRRNSTNARDAERSDSSIASPNLSENVLGALGAKTPIGRAPPRAFVEARWPLSVAAKEDSGGDSPQQFSFCETAQEDESLSNEPHSTEITAPLLESRNGARPANASQRSFGSARSARDFAPIFEDVFLQTFSLSETELRPFTDWLQARQPQIFSLRAADALWESASQGSRGRAPRGAERRPEVRVKVFVGRDERKGVLREKYEVRRELVQSDKANVLLVR